MITLLSFQDFLACYLFYPVSSFNPEKIEINLFRKIPDFPAVFEKLITQCMSDPLRLKSSLQV